MVTGIVFWFLVFGLGAFLWLVRYRKLYVEDILLSISDAAAPLALLYFVGAFALSLLFKFHEITGRISPSFFENFIVVMLYSLVKNWILSSILMAIQAKGLWMFSRAFKKNVLVYPWKIFWGCLLFSAPVILEVAWYVLGFGFFTIVIS